MIFVTVGTQLPFDRLVRTVDRWAEEAARSDVFAQIGPSRFRPSRIRWAEFLDADQCREKVAQARVVVAHAGMGSIISALEMGKPIIVMPRRADLGEHRNDHQVATAKQFLKQGRIEVAIDEASLLQTLRGLDDLRAPETIASHARSQLLDALSTFVLADGLPAAEPVPGT